MKKLAIPAVLVCAAILAAGRPALALRYMTGAVANYASIGGTDLPDTLPEAADFSIWLMAGGHTPVGTWQNGDVWGADFREGTDTNPDPGSDLADLYYFTGHGECENPPTSNTGDFIVTNGSGGRPNVTNIGQSSRWGNAPGRARFMLLDASCPMDLASIPSVWFPAFRGLHIATGHSGDAGHDNRDSVSRGNDFAQTLIGFHAQSVGMGWMTTGTEDVDDDVCAVAIANGDSPLDAFNRVFFEKLNAKFPKPTHNFFAILFTCA